jgi:3-oxoacyl-[acyl-carrier-protein] synthase II
LKESGVAAATRDKKGRPIVAVTGIGVVTSLGVGKSDNWAKLSGGVSGIRRISRFPTGGLRTTIAGAVDEVHRESMSPAELSERVALLAGDEAIAEAGIGSNGHFPGPLFLAPPPLEIEWADRMRMAEMAAANADTGYPDLMRVAREYAAAHGAFKFAIIGEDLAEHFGTQGSPVSLNTACASGASAIQLGMEAIRRGECEAALAIGADASLTPESLVRFSLLSALSTQNDPPERASKPFSKNRDGFVLAEGAAALVLESLEHAHARGARVLGILEGYGEKSDSFHRTRTSPDGKPIIATMHKALADADVGPDDIDYINAHGTSTPENDKMEHLGVATVFGERIRGIPISSNKSMIGHTLTAAGAVEAAFTLLTLQHQRLPPTINHAIPDPAIQLDVVPNVARDAKVRRAISNSFGFGGQNVSLVVALEPA